MTESEFIAALRTLPLHGGALGLMDDAARLGDLVLTSDTLVEGVHFLSADPPGEVAWKLLAVNLSDLAAKGATPDAVMLSYPISDGDWDAHFVAGLRGALAAFGTTLLGGDTISLPQGAPRVLTLTAFGRAQGPIPARSGAKAGDALWVTGAIGDAGAGLDVAGGADGPATLLAAYRRPVPRLAEGRALAPIVHAMMDISDGLLIDTARMGEASGVAIAIVLDDVPLSDGYRALIGDGLAARLKAATAGDDYELLFALPGGAPPPVAATQVGRCVKGAGLSLSYGGEAIPLPARLGWEHG